MTERKTLKKNIKSNRNPVSKNYKIPILSESGTDPGGAIVPLLKPTKVTLFTTILYNSEKSIRDIRPFCHPLFCHSSGVKSFISLTVVNPWCDLTTKYFWNPPLLNLTGRICPWSESITKQKFGRIWIQLQIHVHLFCLVFPFFKILV